MHEEGVRTVSVRVRTLRIGLGTRLDSCLWWVFTHSSFDQSLHVKKYLHNKNEHRLQVILLILFGDIRWDVNWSAVSTNFTCSVFRSIFNTACECKPAQ